MSSSTALTPLEKLAQLGARRRKNLTVDLPLGNWAPVYDGGRRKQQPVRIPSLSSLRATPNGWPYFIPIFDTTSLFQQAQSEGTGGQLGALQTYDNDFQITEDFWLFQIVASFSAGNPVTNPAIVWQLTASVQLPDGSVATAGFQKTPLTAGNIFGSGQEPFSLDDPMLLPAGTELQCSVQNLLNQALTAQIVLIGILAPGEAAAGAS